MSGQILLLFMAVLPFIHGSTFHGYTLYDPTKYECKVVNGGWTEWSCFGHCSVTCGKGYQKRYRHCAAPIPKYGGKSCEGDHIEVKECDSKVECPIDGGWSEYVKGECSVTCGGGQVTYTRQCNNPTPQHCGKQCVGDASYTESCNTHTCPTWSEWNCTHCKTHNKQCLQKCTRTCIYHKTDKNYCVGDDTEIRKCDEEKCKPDNPTRGDCKDCRAEADLKAAQPKYPSTFVGDACRAPDLANLCKTATLSKNGGYPANDWFWVHCSTDGPWCKPCATRNLVFSTKCDACEATADGPCTGSPFSDDKLNDEDLW